MKARNWDLLNDAIEKIWNCESLLNTFETLLKENIVLTDDYFRDFRQEIRELRDLCVRLA